MTDPGSPRGGRLQSQRGCSNLLLPPSNEVAGSECFHRSLFIHRESLASHHASQVTRPASEKGGLPTVVLPQGVCIQGICPEGLCICEICLQGVCIQGGLFTEGSASRRSVYKGVCIWGVCPQEGVCIHGVGRSPPPTRPPPPPELEK